MSHIYFENRNIAQNSAVAKASLFQADLHSPKHNEFLAALPANDYVRLLPHFELVTVEVGDVLHDTGMQIEWVYFPISSVVCVGYITESGSSPAVGIIGKEGFVGIAYVMGSETSSTQATVQSSGLAYRIRASSLKKELQRKGEFLRMALLYAQAFVTQVSQTAVCNRLHSVDQQLCRWLLMSMDRLASSEIHLTHELIANMLGVRREGITQAARKLQAKGLIQYSRGKIHIIDRDGIEEEVCECYGVVSREYERLMPRKLHMPVPFQQPQKIVVNRTRVADINSRKTVVGKKILAGQAMREGESASHTYASAR